MPRYSRSSESMVRRGHGAFSSIVCSPTVISVEPTTCCGQSRDHVLDQLHDGVVVHVGPVELHHGELGIVHEGDALVAEVLADLEDAWSNPPTSSRLR